LPPRRRGPRSLLGPGPQAADHCATPPPREVAPLRARPLRSPVMTCHRAASRARSYAVSVSFSILRQPGLPGVARRHRHGPTGRICPPLSHSSACSRPGPPPGQDVSVRNSPLSGVSRARALGPSMPGSAVASHVHAGWLCAAGGSPGTDGPDCSRPSFTPTRQVRRKNSAGRPGRAGDGQDTATSSRLLALEQVRLPVTAAGLVSEFRPSGPYYPHCKPCIRKNPLRSYQADKRF
jgi:hypothetical protein